MKKLRVGVFMGGKTNEREVSLNSGRTVCDHLDTTRYEAVPIFQTFAGDLYILPWRFLHRGKTTDFEHRLDVEAQAIKWDDLKNIIDFIYIATHGRFAEDGTLQGMLELLGIPYLGSKVFTSALGMDKMMQKKIPAKD
jgi:D-alanine-D-alanine ligase